MGLCPYARPLLFQISHKTPPDSLQDIAPSKTDKVFWFTSGHVAAIPIIFQTGNIFKITKFKFIEMNLIQGDSKWPV